MALLLFMHCVLLFVRYALLYLFKWRVVVLHAVAVLYERVELLLKYYIVQALCCSICLQHRAEPSVVKNTFSP